MLQERRSEIIDAILNSGPSGETGVSGLLAVGRNGIKWRAVFSIPSFLAPNEERIDLGETMCKPSVINMAITKYNIVFPDHLQKMS